MKQAFINGTIHTLDKKNSSSNTLLVHGDRIFAVGNDLSTDGYTLVDLQGHHIYPGLIDSHMHLVNCGYTNSRVKLFDVTSLEDLSRPILKYKEIHQLSDDDWIRGRGWNNDYFTGPKNFPTRYDLDKISKTNPIVITRVCGHIASCNSIVLEKLGMSESAPSVIGGEIDVDSNGVPLGIFRESALDILYSAIPEPPIEEVKEMILSTVTEMNSFGLTGSQTDDFCTLPGSRASLVMDAYQELIQEEKLSVRVYQQAQFPSIDLFQQFLKEGYTTGSGDDLFKIGPLKLLLDGALGAKTAALREPYADDPENTGIYTMTKEVLSQWLSLANEHNMNAAIHCIGDGALERALNGFAANYDSKARNSIVHCQITDLELLQRMANEGILAMVQPIFLDYDYKIVRDRVGKERESTSYVWKTMIDLGIPTSFGTDAPVEHFNPFHNMYEAITRKDLEGNPREGWLPEQAITPLEALYAYTRESAYASFEEDKKGSLEPEKLADFFIVPNDLCEITPEELRDTKVLETYLDGKQVYKNQG